MLDGVGAVDSDALPARAHARARARTRARAGLNTVVAALACHIPGSDRAWRTGRSRSGRNGRVRAAVG